MKNIFKFLGLAVLACGMMVACGNDTPEEGNDTTPVNPNPPAPQESYKINYLSEWEVGATAWLDHTDENYLTIYAWKSADDAMVTQGFSDVLIYGFMESVPGESDYTASAGDCMNLTDPTSTFYYEGDDNNEAGNYYKYTTATTKSTFVENVTSFDANTMRYTATWAEQYMDVEAYLAGNEVYGEMTGTIVNYPVVWASK